MQWQFGPYRVESVIARGGMGEILRAYDTRHDRVVALKLLAPDLAEDPEFRARFQREAHAAGRLREPHVIPIHGYGEINGRLYLDMRLVEGHDLGALLTAGGPMPPAKVVAIIEQLACALDAAHREGLVHRDVKPSNVLLGGDEFAYLVDFGIAASLTGTAFRTANGITMGTLAYMAPERFGNRPFDHRVDVYSLACVLYQCLTGRLPFGQSSTEAVIYAHLNERPPKPSVVRGEIPAAFDRIVLRGMAKNPADRYPNAGELARAARSALAGLPAATGSGRRRWPVTAAAVCVVAALAGLATVLTTARTAEPRRPMIPVPHTLTSPAGVPPPALPAPVGAPPPRPAATVHVPEPPPPPAAGRPAPTTTRPRPAPAPPAPTTQQYPRLSWPAPYPWPDGGRYDGRPGPGGDNDGHHDRPDGRPGSHDGGRRDSGGR